VGFHTPQFFILLVACFSVYWAAKGRRLLVLAVFDSLFYLYAGLLDFGLLAGAALTSYVSGLGMRGRHRKIFLILGVGINVLNLAFFKYYYFFLGNVSKLVEVPVSLRNLRVVLPIGISFYTFQLIAYLVDVYREEIPPVKSFLEFWVFISFFGQVIAGPIMRARDFVPQVAKTEEYRLDITRLQKGLILFTIGLAKKLILADSLSPLVDKYFLRGASMSSIDVWVAAYLFGFQIYYDFSAYSDMALAAGHFFGYDLTQNFNTPYLSRNPQEFWRRWHITLSSWVRDYLYIPMGGSRKGFARGLLAVIASMCISGLWHGASWTFAMWGLYHGLLSACHRVWRKTFGRSIRDTPLVRMLSTFMFLQATMIGWILFRVQNAQDLWPLIAKMVSFSDLSRGPHLLHYALLIIGLYFLHPIEWAVRKNSSSLWAWWQNRVPPLVRGLAYSAVILVLCVFLRPKVNAFIYFQF